MSAPIVFFGLGIAALASAVVARFNEVRARASWKRALGEVVAVERQRRPGGRTMHAHVLRFEANSGDVVELAPVNSRFPYYKVGQTAPVLFDPQNPRHAVVDELGWRWGRTVWWLIGAAWGCLILAGALWDA